MTSALRSFKHDAKYLGFSFYWAWMSLAFFSTAPYGHAENSNALVQQAWLWMAGGAIMMRVIHILLKRRLPVLSACRPLVVVATLISMVGASVLCLSVVPEDIALGQIMAVAGGAMCGFGACWCTIMWGEAYAGKDAESSFRLISLTFVTTALIHFIVIMLPGPLPLIFTVLLYGASFILLTSLMRERREKPEPTRKAKPPARFAPSALIPLVAIFVYASCGEVFHTLLTIPGQAADLRAMGTWYTLGGGLGSLLMLLVAVVANAFRERRTDFLCLNLSLVLMAVGVMLPQVVPVSMFVSYAVFGAAFWAFRNMVWTYSAKVVTDTKASPIVVYGVTQNMFAFAILFGSPFVRWITSALHFGEMAWGVVSTVMLFVVLVVALALSVNRQTLWGLLPETPLPQSGKHLEQRLAEGYGLTPRECEVALLLARGRSLPYIQDKLYISEGTAKSHLKSIYRKLSVNSKQEYLDVIEEIERR